jgi:hypothetical protein
LTKGKKCLNVALKQAAIKNGGYRNHGFFDLACFIGGMK